MGRTRRIVLAVVAGGAGGLAPLSPARATPTIVIDYSLDTSGFFSSNPVAKSTLEYAAARIGGLLAQPLGATQDMNSASVHDATGDPNFSSTATFDFYYQFFNPSTGSTFIYNPAVVPANQVTIFAGARNLSGPELGLGGASGLGFNLSGSLYDDDDFRAAVVQAAAAANANVGRGGGPTIGTLNSSADGQNFSISYGPALGSIAFDNDTNDDGMPDTAAQLNAFWQFDRTQPPGGKNDFYSVCVHEMLHALGFGSSKSFAGELSPADNRDWLGSNLIALLGTGDNVMAGDNAHFAQSLTAPRFADGAAQETIMAPALTQGTRKDVTLAEIAALQDIGWNTIDPTTLHWTAGGSGLWSGEANWTALQVPMAVHNAIIDPGTTLTVTGPSVSTAVKSLTIGGGAGAATLALGGGPLVVGGGNLTVISNGALTGGASSSLNTTGGTLVNQGSFNTAGMLIAGAIINSGFFAHTGASATHLGDFTNTAGTAVLSGAQSWANGTHLSVLGGAVSMTSNPGSDSAYNLIAAVTPAAGSASLTFGGGHDDQVQLRSLGVNAVGSGGDGLVVIGAATGGHPSGATGFGGVGGSVRVYLGDGGGGAGPAPRATVEALWDSAVFEGYWAKLSGFVTTVTRGVTLANGVVSNTARNGFAVVNSFDDTFNTVTYLGEDVIGDVNGDGAVDSADITQILRHLNKAPGTVAGEAGYTLYTWGEGDLNGDENVDSADVTLALSNLGKTYNPSLDGGGVAAVPEPGAGGLVMVVGAGLLGRRRGRRLA